MMYFIDKLHAVDVNSIDIIFYEPVSPYDGWLIYSCKGSQIKVPMDKDSAIQIIKDIVFSQRLLNGNIPCDNAENRSYANSGLGDW